ncbi:MAG: type IX secretion system membrane protein PorP/SprF [Flavobacteriales bacterium]|nr:type IX secretion system membrane protein PorP/SprF [Flavobacteriales bacterium]
MKKLLISTAFLFAGFVATAQQDAQFTQNMFNKLSVNPGSAGHNGGICATFLTRSQWMGFDGRPQTHLFSADARFSKHGVGLTIFQDKLGIESSLIAKLAYSYHLTLGAGELGIGLEVGLINKSFGDEFIAIDDFTQDPSIPNASTSAMTFDAGLGIYYHIKDKMYVGISTLHLPQSELEDVADGGGQGALNYASSRHYYIMAGYDWDMSGGARKWVLKPSILAKTDASSTQLDLNALVEYNKLVWGGVTYRVQDAVAILAGVHIPQLPGLKLGISYDVTTSALGDHSSGSLEFMIKYCTNIVSPPKREVYHSVRFL